MRFWQPPEFIHNSRDVQYAIHEPILKCLAFQSILRAFKLVTGNVVDVYAGVSFLGTWTRSCGVLQQIALFTLLVVAHLSTNRVSHSEPRNTQMSTVSRSFGESYFPKRKAKIEKKKIVTSGAKASDNNARCTYKLIREVAPASIAEKVSIFTY